MLLHIEATVGGDNIIRCYYAASAEHTGQPYKQAFCALHESVYNEVGLSLPQEQPLEEPLELPVEEASEEPGIEESDTGE